MSIFRAAMVGWEIEKQYIHFFLEKRKKKRFEYFHLSKTLLKNNKHLKSGKNTTYQVIRKKTKVACIKIHIQFFSELLLMHNSYKIGQFRWIW